MLACWYKGIPPIEAVEAHETTHLRQDDIDWIRTVQASYGEGDHRSVPGDARVFGNWIINHIRSNIKPYVGISRLKVIDGHVFIALGFCQWLKMDTCRWINDIECYPVADDGLPEAYVGRISAH
jgi:allantoicase